VFIFKVVSEPNFILISKGEFLLQELNKEAFINVSVMTIEKG
jgi:hypothetical protein